MKTKQIKNLLQKANLDWTVSMHNLETQDTSIVIPKHKAIIRDDTQEVMGLVKSQYVPFQNEELMELLVKISGKTGLELHSGGFFKAGQRVWAQLKSNDLLLPDGDKIKGYITGVNSHDGSSSLAFGNWLYTVSCSNSWWKAYREVQSRLRHLSTMHPKIDLILNQIDELLLAEKETFEDVKRLQTYEVDDLTVWMAISKWFELSKEERLADLSKATLIKIGEFNSVLEMEMDAKGKNGWGLFSGVTKYTTHFLRKEKDTTEDKLFGLVGSKEQEIYAYLKEAMV